MFTSTLSSFFGTSSSSEFFISLLLLIISSTFVCMYVILFSKLYSVMVRRRERMRFFTGIISILDNSDDDHIVSSQVDLLFNRTSSWSRFFKSVYKSPSDVLEDFLFRIDTHADNSFKSTYGIERPMKHRGRIINVISILEESDPFSTLPNKQANMLKILQHAIMTNNTVLARNSIKNVSDDIAVTLRNLEVENRRNRNSFIVSTIGLILAIVFGAVSLLQFALQALQASPSQP